MSIFQRLFGRKPDHDAWLATHPGKESKPAPAATIDPEEEKRTRELMEGEMAAQRDQRDTS